MKKLFYNIALISVLMLIFSSTNLQSQTPPGCPPGATNSIVTTFTVDGCDFEVQICWKCKVTSSPLWFAVTSIRAIDNCVPYVDIRDALDSIYHTISGYSWLYTFCGTEIPPCSTGTFEFSERRYNCFKKYQPWIIPPATDLPPMRFFTCDFSSWCQKDYEACMVSPGNMQLTVINDWYQVGVPNCEEDEPVNPLQGQDSDCWLMKPDCD